MKNPRFITSGIIAITLVICSYLFSNAYRYKFKSTQTIEVTGLGKKDFNSDMVRWSASFQKKNMELRIASEELKNDQEMIKKFLLSRGVSEKEIVFEAVNIHKEFKEVNDPSGNSSRYFDGYNLSQTVTIESKNLDRVEGISREISNLISQGIELNSNTPNYFYSKLEDLKLELISEATDNALKRAENIANKADANLGKLLSAKMGIFQITGQNEQEDFSYGGVFNTSARKKTANITVKLIYQSN